MKYSKRIIVASGAAGVIGLAGIGATALAATSSTPNYPPIVQKIASTFGLDPTKVNDVFKQQHLENRQDRDARIKSILDQDVKDGKITQDQENKIVAKLKELRNQLQNDRQQDHQQLRTELEQWAKDNGITNLDQLLPPMGPHHGMGHGGGAASNI